MVKKQSRASSVSNKASQDGHTTQSARFIEAAREAGCSEDEAVFDAALKKIVKARPDAEKQEHPKDKSKS